MTLFPNPLKKLGAAVGIAAATAAVSSEISELTAPSPSVHWSFYIVTVGALSGVVIAVASAILAQWSMLAAGVALTAFNTLSSIFIKRFSLYREIERYLTQLTAIIEKVNEAHEKVCEAIDSLNIEEADIHQAAAALADAESKADENLQARSKIVDNQLKRLASAQKRISDLKDGLTEQQQATLAASKSVISLQTTLSEERNRFLEQTKKLEHIALEIAAQAKARAQADKELDNDTDILDIKMKEIQHLLHGAQSTLPTSQQAMKAAEVIKSQLAESSEAFQSSADYLAAKLEALSKRLELASADVKNATYVAGALSPRG